MRFPHGSNHADGQAERLRYSTSLVLWILFFCYSTSAALLFQKFLLPLLPSLHGGEGLLDGDSLYFHSVAVDLAEKIRLHGWGSWQLYPAPGATGNVAILAALYAIFNYDPSLIVPINAAVHALGGVLIFQIGRLLAPGESGRLAGIITAFLFVGFPSALNWYGQVHKDGFAIAGTLLIIYAWLWAKGRPGGSHSALMLGLATVGATLLIALVRPYNLIPLLGVMLAVSVLMLAGGNWRPVDAWKQMGVYALSLSILVMGAAWAKSSGVNERYSYADLAATGYLEDWRWKPSDWMPKLIEGYLEATARTRASLIVSGEKLRAGSMIDTDTRPDDVLSVAAYAPRAVQIGLFAPFPTQWFEKINPARLVAVGETLIWYLLVPGVVLAVIYARSPAMLIALSYATLFLFIYGFTIANLGTLYRIRYPYLFLFMLFGAIGWVRFFLSRRQRAHPRSNDGTGPVVAPAAAGTATPDASRSGVFSAGAVVAIFTVLTYAGLFLRDVILARWFGVGPELDALFIAVAIPMFLVAAFSIPLGIMLIPQFLSARAQQSPTAAQQLVSNIASVYVILVIPFSLLLYLAAPEVVALAGSNLPSATRDLCVLLLRWMLPILAVSGLVVIGNALLNALGRYSIPASAQMAVPIMSILTFVVFGKQFGVVAAIVGMLIGQILNLWLVVTALRRSGHSPFPRWLAPSPRLREAASQYLPLVAAALFVNLAAPVNMSMASSLTAGSAAALGLGNKVVVFITGIASAAVATVILPYFSSYMARNRLLDVRNELSFFLFAATVVTIPLTLLLFVASEPIVRLAFEGGAFGEGDVQSVTKVMSYGIIQLPFYTVNLLILKFAVATRHAGRVMVVSLLGLVINIGLNLVLMVNSGAAGIALATTLAIAISTCLLLLFFNRLGHISWVDLVMIAFNWMLFTTLVVCLHYQSYAGAVVAIIALVVLLYGEWNVLIRWRAAT